MITRKAKFTLTDKWTSSEAHYNTDYRILLEDADGVDVKYLVTDYRDEDGNVDRVIFNDNEDQNMVDIDSYIGKKILTFMKKEGYEYKR
tara:strand:- start:1268 stop:1534 length:267 start_codon:yes stop_codon:yes gene_type:complete